MFILDAHLGEKVTKNIHRIENFDPSVFTKENGKLILNKKYKIGTIFTKNDHFFLQCEGTKKDFLIEQEHLIGSDEGDFVLAQTIFNPRGKLRVKVVLVLEKSSNETLAIWRNKQWYSVKNNNKYTPIHEINAPQEGDIYLFGANNTLYLGNAQNAVIDEILSLYLFKEEVRLERYEWDPYPNTPQQDARKNLTHLPFCTIDPIGAKDHDDAIYYDEHTQKLYVAIADVSHYVKEGSSLDEAAKLRGFSVYFPNKVFPMLPFILSSDLCSLKPNCLRYAFVCEITLDLINFEVKESSFYEAVIESKNNFSYEVIDEQISQGTLDQSLKALLLITQKRRAIRLHHGYDFRNVELRLHLDNAENLIGVTESQSTLSHHLVEECMLLANQESAKKINNFGIFRIHEEPDMKKIDKLLENLASIGILVKKKKDIHSTIEAIQKEARRFYLEKEVDTLIIQSQQQARYSSQRGDHFGLGFSHYSHFTSPIRRYADLLLHRILKSKTVPKDIESLCEQISNKEREIAKMVWDLEARKYARWAMGHPNQRYEAILSDLGEKNYATTKLPIEGMKIEITNYQGERLYGTIVVEVVLADPISKQITGKIVR